MNKFIFLCLGIFIGCSHADSILHDLTESDVNDLHSILYNANITSSRVHQPNGLWGISVAPDDEASAISLLNSASIVKGLKVRSSGDLSPGVLGTREDRQFYLERARGVQIEKTLLSIPSIVDARVHLYMPTRVDSMFHDQETLSHGASVMIVTTSQEVSKDDVRSLVAGASGIEAKSIMIWMVHREDWSSIGHMERSENQLNLESRKNSTSFIIYRNSFLAILAFSIILVVLSLKAYPRKRKIKETAR